MRRASAYSQIVAIFQQLHKDYPTYNIGRHLATALDEYGDVWGMTDQEVLFALEKYRAQLHMDVKRSEPYELQRILKEGMDLDNILKEEDNGDS